MRKFSGMHYHSTSALVSRLQLVLIVPNLNYSLLSISLTLGYHLSWSRLLNLMK